MARKSKTPATAWLDSGLQALAKGGPQALSAEGLARSMGTTKGSFYWHFPDLAAFREALPERFIERVEVPADVGHGLDPASLPDLRSFWRHAAFSHEPGYEIECSMRDLSHSCASAALCINRLDAHRARILNDILSARGLTNPSFGAMLFSAWLGARQSGMAEGEADEMLLTLVDLILALE